ncbi:MAG: hypothetical protein ACI9EW_001044 [Cellvibrionaceae bacterium]|jgi:hypothetical protein
MIFRTPILAGKQGFTKIYDLRRLPLAALAL